jgi:hypothetical protein
LILLSDLVLASSFSSARCPDFLRAELFPVKRVKDSAGFFGRLSRKADFVVHLRF